MKLLVEFSPLDTDERCDVCSERAAHAAVIGREVHYFCYQHGLDWRDDHMAGWSSGSHGTVYIGTD